MSDSNYTRLAYVEETTFGTTPSANLQTLRRTGGNINPQRTTVTSEEIRSDLRSGKPVRTQEWAQGDINFEWSYNTFDDILEGMLMNAWDSTVLDDGTTEKSYTFESSFIDPSFSPDQFLIYKGCRIGAISLNLALGAIVRGSFSVLGAIPSVAQASVGTGYTAQTSTGPFNTVDMVTDIEENNSNITRMVGVDINLSRNLRQKGQIGSLNPFDIGVGRLLVVGTVQQYFQDDTLIDAWFSFNDRSLEVQFTDDATNILRVEIPKLKWVGSPTVDVPGPDADCMVSMNFEAYANVGDAALIKFIKTDT